MNKRALLFGLAAVTVAAVGGAIAGVSVRAPLPQTTTSGKADIGGPFSLAATTGQNVTDRTYRGKWLVMFFGYTSCPDVCPTTLANLSAALHDLGGAADRLQPLFVTVDPARDTRPKLAKYLKSFDPRIVGLSGSQDQIAKVVKEYHVYVEKQESGDHGNYVVSHSSYLYLMDPQGQFVDVLNGLSPGDAIAAWLRKKMQHESGSEAQRLLVITPRAADA